MKTIKMKGRIRRVSDKEAHQHVSNGYAEYTSKSEWKKTVRDVEPKVKENKKRKKRNERKRTAIIK